MSIPFKPVQSIEGACLRDLSPLSRPDQFPELPLPYARVLPRETLRKYDSPDLYTTDDGRLLCTALWDVQIDNDHHDGVAMFLVTSAAFQSGLYSACGVALFQASSKAATISRMVRGSELKV